MRQETDALRVAKSMLPLIRSIARETRERKRAIRDLEAKLEALASRRGEPITEIRRVESDLFLHRREIERVEKELTRLGCKLDLDHPRRIVCSADGNEWSYDDRLDETGYRPDKTSPKA